MAYLLELLLGIFLLIFIYYIGICFTLPFYLGALLLRRITFTANDLMIMNFPMFLWSILFIAYFKYKDFGNVIELIPLGMSNMFYVLARICIFRRNVAVKYRKAFIIFSSVLVLVLFISFPSEAWGD